ncbi:substrate-binding domain-containing protein [Microbispora corallina]|uniref:VWA domain-containing protein n=1 Tax=Microbispora corallina TaxID=83302 RepID=A0ABQ4G3R5_9ACTN|nr:VWA domain-containing protein [Microbispora corallina]GIH41711.1 VWA domain-containing protein [Microbispora corallina]
MRPGTRLTRHVPRRVTAAAAAALLLLPLAACGGSGGEPEGNAPDVLRVLAGSEVKDLEPLLAKAADAVGVKVRLSYAGTLDGAEEVANGGADGRYDATWFSSNRYLSLIDGASAKLSTQTKVMVSPVVLGLRRAKAHELGWDTRRVTWADIATAAGQHRFTFGMTNPASSNSGFSALVGVTAALSDAGEALDKSQIESVTPQLTRFFSAQTLTAGSSGWLADAYARQGGSGGSVDGLINYESVLLGLAGRLKEPLTLVYPSDGVVTADYPLTLLASSPKKELYGKLAAWLRTPAVQREIMTTTNRRPIVPEVRPDQRFGGAQLLELPFPNRRSAADELISAYLNQVRRPSRTLFVLDTSGSMEGDRIDALKQALAALTGADTSVSGQFSRFRNRETVTLLPFSSAPATPQTFTVPDRDATAVLGRIRAYGDALHAFGGTAIYDSLRSAYETLAGERSNDDFTSVVLMTDGENTDGSSYDDFAAYYRTARRKVPTFVVLFGDSDVGEMRQVAQLTGGAAFDARTGSLASAFKEIRGYQ